MYQITHSNNKEFSKRDERARNDAATILILGYARKAGLTRKLVDELGISNCFAEITLKGNEHKTKRLFSHSSFYPLSPLGASMGQIRPR
jgi:hypothetical protein